VRRGPTDATSRGAVPFWSVLLRVALLLLAAFALAGCDVSVDLGNGGDGGDGGNGAPTVDPFADYTFPPLDMTPRPVITLGPDDTPGPTLPDLAPYLTAGLSMVNISDSDIDVILELVDNDSGTKVVVVRGSLGQAGSSERKVPRGTYVLTFTPKATGVAAVCTFSMDDEDAIEFVALRDHIVVTKSGFSPATGADIDIATSRLCVAGFN
jgi:hypothetical protein